MEHVGFFRI